MSTLLTPNLLNLSNSFSTLDLSIDINRLRFQNYKDDTVWRRREKIDLNVLSKDRRLYVSVRLTIMIVN